MKDAEEDFSHLGNKRCLYLQDKSLTEFPNLEKFMTAELLDISSNPIRSFAGLTFLPSLKFLSADNTSIESFKGSLVLPCLKELSLEETPVSKHKPFRIMALMAFGNTLEIINGKCVSDSLKQKASEKRALFKPFLDDGYVIVDLIEQTIWKPGETHMLQIDLSPEEIKEKRNQIEENDRIIEMLMREESPENADEKVPEEDTVE